MHVLIYIVIDHCANNYSWGLLSARHFVHIVTSVHSYARMQICNRELASEFRMKSVTITISILTVHVHLMDICMCVLSCSWTVQVNACMSLCISSSCVNDLCTFCPRLRFEDEEEEVVRRRVSSTPSQEGPELVTMPSRFERVQEKGTIDVWWIYDEGGKLLTNSWLLHTVPTSGILTNTRVSHAGSSTLYTCVCV